MYINHQCPRAFDAETNYNHATVVDMLAQEKEKKGPGTDPRYPVTVSFRVARFDERKAIEAAAARIGEPVSLVCRSIVLGSLGLLEPDSLEAKVVAHPRLKR